MASVRVNSGGQTVRAPRRLSAVWRQLSRLAAPTRAYGEGGQTAARRHVWLPLTSCRVGSDGLSHRRWGSASRFAQSVRDIRVKAASRHPHSRLGSMSPDARAILMHRGFAPRASPSRVELAGDPWVPTHKYLYRPERTSLTPHLLPPANFRGTALGTPALYFLYHHSTTTTTTTRTCPRTLAFPFDTHTPPTLVHAHPSDDNIADARAKARRARRTGCGAARGGGAGGRERREGGPRARRRHERGGQRDGQHGGHIRDCGR